jgi:hypothetical protein
MRELAQLDVTDNKRLILSIGEFRNDLRVDLRQYVRTKDDKGVNFWIPTRKGVNFSVEWIDKFLEMIKKLENE